VYVKLAVITIPRMTVKNIAACSHPHVPPKTDTIVLKLATTISVCRRKTVVFLCTNVANSVDPMLYRPLIRFLFIDEDGDVVMVLRDHQDHQDRDPHLLRDPGPFLDLYPDLFLYPDQYQDPFLYPHLPDQYQDPDPFLDLSPDPDHQDPFLDLSPDLKFYKLFTLIKLQTFVVMSRFWMRFYLVEV
jgi:hypothetical protein